MNTGQLLLHIIRESYVKVIHAYYDNRPNNPKIILLDRMEINERNTNLVDIHYTETGQLKIFICTEGHIEYHISLAEEGSVGKLKQLIDKALIL